MSQPASALEPDLSAAGFALGHAAYIRIFKRESVLELWLQSPGKAYGPFRSYPVCAWSGTLGPKLTEGDRQSPEGFYRVGLRSLNPRSRFHRAFNLGFPNAYDRSFGRTGSLLMVHGGCSSVGCYAMTDPGIDEIYRVVEAALLGGQDEVDVAIFPFRMTETALQAEAASAWAPFWRNLAQGYALFEASRLPPRVAARNGSYVFGKDAEGSDDVPVMGTR